MPNAVLLCAFRRFARFLVQRLLDDCSLSIFFIAKALPPKVLNNVFCRFGDLIDVYMLPNKNCGYAKYASESSAVKAIETLHSAEICGIKLKVMEAEEPRDAKRKRYDD